MISSLVYLDKKETVGIWDCSTDKASIKISRNCSHSHFLLIFVSFEYKIWLIILDIWVIVKT